jgi:hypothetical protein
MFQCAVDVRHVMGWYVMTEMSWGSSVDIATAGVRFPTGVRDFSLLHSAHTGSGANRASYPMGTVGSFPGG